MFESGKSYSDIQREELQSVYTQLKDKYPLIMTTTVELNAGYTNDFPILVGKKHGQVIELCWIGSFVLDVMDEAKTKGIHWYPKDIDAAVCDITAFMEGKSDYELTASEQQQIENWRIKRVEIESRTICTPYHGGYPEYYGCVLYVYDDHYLVSITVHDTVELRHHEEKRIEKGSLAPMSLEELAELFDVSLDYDKEKIVENKALLEVIEQDKTFDKLKL